MKYDEDSRQSTAQKKEMDAMRKYYRNKPANNLISYVKNFIKYIFFSFYNLIINKNRLTTTKKGVQKKYYLSAMIRVKNESRFIAEFISYHMEIGVEHFYIYNNNSTDDILNTLKVFVDNGIITLVDWPIIPASPTCYKNFWVNYANLSTWVAFIDVDEFIVENSTGLLLQHLREIENNAPALALYWKYFGSNNHINIPKGLVIENFTSCNKEIDHHFKVIAQPDKVHSHYNSHNFCYNFFSFANNYNQKSVFGSRSYFGLDAPIRINHYIYRSKQNFLEKSRRGYVSASGANRDVRNENRAEIEFQKHNDIKNDYLSKKYSKFIRARLCGLGYKSDYYK